MSLGPIGDPIQRYHLTHELYMLQRLRYGIGGLSALHVHGLSMKDEDAVRQRIMEREYTLMDILGLTRK